MSLRSENAEYSTSVHHTNELLNESNKHHRCARHQDRFSTRNSTVRASQFPKERCKTGLAVLLLLMAAISNDVVIAYIHDLVPDQPPLPDIIFDNFTYRPAAMRISECLMLSLLIVLAILIFVHEHRWILVRRIATLAALLYFGRAVTMFVTQLPKADPNFYCSPKLDLKNRTVNGVLIRATRFFSAFGLVMAGNENLALCGDYVYSGHTIVLVLCYLFIVEYSPKSWKFLHSLSAAASLVGVVCLIVSRGHYTVDVIIAYWITTRVFWQYHTMTNFAILRDPHCEDNHLRKVIWYPLFEYMEASVYQRLPQKYSLPFTWYRQSYLRFTDLISRYLSAILLIPKMRVLFLVVSVCWLLFAVAIGSSVHTKSLLKELDNKWILFEHQFSYPMEPFLLGIQFGETEMRLDYVIGFGECRFHLKLSPPFFGNLENVRLHVTQIGNNTKWSAFHGNWLFTEVANNYIKFHETQNTVQYNCTSTTFQRLDDLYELKVSIYGQQLPDEFSICHNFPNQNCIHPLRISGWTIAFYSGIVIILVGVVILSGYYFWSKRSTKGASNSQGSF
ncbi:PAP2-C domain-containing protein [Aphelenchoides besseyi]|nr:PAP2-C domain-containing protein [Aphelenchoides besseyi]